MVVSLHMGWRHVLFANWPVNPQLIAPHLPENLPLDTFDGHAWLSIVPFTNVDVRPAILPDGTGFQLPELNVRTYVKHDGTPGVYFFSLDAEGIVAVIGARLFHHLPYFYASIEHTVTADHIQFWCQRKHPGARPAHFSATYAGRGSKMYAEPETVAHFLTERYRYYTESPGGSIRYADVEHEPWPLYDAVVSIDTNTVLRANGFTLPASDPVYLYSPGVDTVASPNKPAEVDQV